MSESSIIVKDQNGRTDEIKMFAANSDLLVFFEREAA